MKARDGRKRNGMRQRPTVLVTVQETRTTELGSATWITVERSDGARLLWSEVHDAFTERYPGRWAVQVFPPEARLFAGANRYHLWVLDHEPAGLDLGATCS